MCKNKNHSKENALKKKNTINLIKRDAVIAIIILAVLVCVCTMNVKLKQCQWRAWKNVHALNGACSRIFKIASCFLITFSTNMDLPVKWTRVASALAHSCPHLECDRDDTTEYELHTLLN